MNRPTFAKFKKKALENSEVKKEYEALAVAYDKMEIDFVPIKSSPGDRSML